MNNSHKTRIVIAEDFSRFPGGRFPEDGDYNGEKFRRKFLVPALKKFDKVEVVFDGVAGFGSSFLEEAFGGLVRSEGFNKRQLDNKLILIASEVELQDDLHLTKKFIKIAAEENK